DRGRRGAHPEFAAVPPPEQTGHHAQAARQYRRDERVFLWPVLREPEIVDAERRARLQRHLRAVREVDLRVAVALGTDRIARAYFGARREQARAAVGLLRRQRAGDVRHRTGIRERTGGCRSQCSRCRKRNHARRPSHSSLPLPSLAVAGDHSGSRIFSRSTILAPCTSMNPPSCRSFITRLTITRDAPIILAMSCLGSRLVTTFWPFTSSDMSISSRATRPYTSSSARLPILRSASRSRRTRPRITACAISKFSARHFLKSRLAIDSSSQASIDTTLAERGASSIRPISPKNS